MSGDRPAAPPRVVLIGAGGLGCAAALALAEESRARGLRLRLELLDDDAVERSNLSRQVLFGEADVGEAKVFAAAAALQVGPAVAEAAARADPLEVVPLRVRFAEDNARDLLRGAAALLDGSDDVPTRFLANDAARGAGVPLVHGAALGWTGHLLTALPGEGGCLRCLFEAPPPVDDVPACSQAGVASPLCGLVGAAMASEAILLLRGQPPRAASRLLRWNGRSGAVRATSVPRDPSCPACAASAARAS